MEFYELVRLALKLLNLIADQGMLPESIISMVKFYLWSLMQNIATNLVVSIGVSIVLYCTL